jgi:DNA-binding transcriptional LysR family regulator
MELVHLECFVALGDELHFGRAAARLHMGTPSMSKRVAELERGLGVRLFDRTSRDVRLTPAGEALLEQANRALAEVGNLRTMAADAAAGAVGAVHAAYAPGTGELMTRLLRELRRRSPDVEVHPVQMISIRVAAAIRSKMAAVGIARVPPGRDLATVVIAESPFNVVVVPASHPLAAKDEVCPEDLAEETLIGPSPSLGVGPSRLASARFRAAEVSTEGEMFDLVSSGFGLFVTTEGSAHRNPRSDIVTRPFVGYPETAKELLIWRPDDDSPIVKAIRQVAEEIRGVKNAAA